MIIDGNHILPSEGYAYITNGTVWASEAYLGRSDSADNWHDTNEEPPSPEDEEEVDPEEVLSELEAML